MANTFVSTEIRKMTHTSATAMTSRIGKPGDRWRSRYLDTGPSRRNMIYQAGTFRVFAEFVETGDVTDSGTNFVEFFERDERCQMAVERAFNLRIGRLQDAIRVLEDGC